MARKIVLSVLAVAVVLVMGRFAAAEAPVMASGESGIVNHSDGREIVGDSAFSSPESTADPETKYLSGEPWLERGPVETGSVPAMREGVQEPRCCDNPVDAMGNTQIRHGIDDGP